MNDLNKRDHGKLFRLRSTGELGRLEAPPLHDPGSVEESEVYRTGILWIPDFGDEAERWQYVTAEDVVLDHPPEPSWMESRGFSG